MYFFFTLQLVFALFTSTLVFFVGVQLGKERGLLHGAYICSILKPIATQEVPIHDVIDRKDIPSPPIVSPCKPRELKKALVKKNEVTTIPPPRKSPYCINPKPSDMAILLKGK